MRRLRWVIVALLLAPLAAVAQTPPPVQVGSRVRIWHHCAPACQRTTGTVVRLTPDSILLNADHQFSPTAIARGSVSTFEVANGRKSRALVVAGAGFLIGSTVGLLIGTAVDPPDPNAFLDFGGGPAGFVVGALLGTVFGAAIGAGAGPERWVAVGGEQAQIGLGPAPRGGWAFGGAFRF